MRQSELFTKTLKEAPKDEQSVNAQLLIRAGFIDKLFAGAYTMLPLGLRVIKKIENIIREEMNKAGGQEVLMPALHPLENYEKTGRSKIDVLFYTELRAGAKLVLGQSHEEIVTPLVQKFVFSYKDLPRKVYQFQTKFRNELRAKSGIFRGREFIMKDFYSFHATDSDLDEYYEKMRDAYFSVFERCGLLDFTHYTFASGGTFSKYSHEFQTVTEAGEDVIFVCKNCDAAVNKEIKDEVIECPDCGGKEFREEKSIEVGNIFRLGNKFSNAFDFKFMDEKGEKNDVLMGCYGIGLGRLMGTVAEIHHDERGLIWPDSVAPFTVHLIDLEKGKDAEKIYNMLQEAGIEVLFDDRIDKGAGGKLMDADLIGLPYRIVVSEKTLKKKSVEVKRRGEEEIEMVKIDRVVGNFLEK